MFRKTESCLKENEDKLQKLAELLLQKETLNYQDVEDLLGRFMHFIHLGMLGNFPNAISLTARAQSYFPKWQLPKCAISQAVTSLS